MTGSSAPSFDSVESILRDSGADTDAAEAHGTLCGLTCMLGPAAGPSWIAGMVERAGDGSSTRDALELLDALAVETCRTLEERDMSFQPLLPGDEEPLALRADSLARWCQGFSHGLVIGANTVDAVEALDAGMTGEIVQDFSELAQAGFGDDEAAAGSEAESEAAYTELVEYVRVSVQLVFEEFADLRDRPPSPGSSSGPSPAPH